MARWVDTDHSSVQDGLYAPGKTLMHSTTSLRCFPKIAFETVPMFIWLTMPLSHPLKVNCLALSLSLPLSSKRLVVWWPWLCAHRKCLKHLNTSDLRKMSQAPRSKPLGLLCQPLTIAHLEKQLDFKRAWSSCVFNVELLFWVSYGPTLMNSCYMHTQTVPSPS